MKLIIPMAGFGSRMRPHTWSKPKPLINVAGKPFLGHLLDRFASLDIEELVIIYGWLGDQIQAYFHDAYPQLNVHYVEQAELKGQSHALWLAREYLDGDGIIILGDTFFAADLGVLAAPEGDGIAFIKEVEDPRRFGVVELDDDGYVTRFIEKPTSKDNKKVVIGFYWVHDLPWMIRCIEEHMAAGKMFKGEFFLTDTFQVMVERGAKFRTHAVDVWQDTGKPETTLQTNRYLLDDGCDNSAQLDLARGIVVPPVYVGRDVVVENAVIGPYANVVSGAVIRNAVVRDSIIDAGAVIEDVVLEGSLIGEQAHVKGQPTRLNIGHSATAGLEYEVDESWV
jgi:glucose-1-phosphate thymidylyltransferase